MDPETGRHPGADSRHDLTRSVAVVQHGMFAVALTNATVALWVLGATGALALAAVAAGGSLWDLLPLRLGVALSAVLAAYALFRLYAAVRFWRRRSDDTSASPARPSTPHEPPSGSVITCSGGGVKSASFSLGALQRLAEEGVYERASAVVGVSGGGYMAAAFAVHRLRADAEHRPRRTALARGSDDEAALRRVTNYLVATSRVRFDLAVSVALGALLNVLLGLGSAVLLGWVVGSTARDTRLVSVSDHGAWAVSATMAGWALLPAGIAVAVAVLWFVAVGVGGAPRSMVALSRGPARVPADRPDVRVPMAEVVDWMRGVPSALTAFALWLLVVYPGAPLVAALLNRSFPRLVAQGTAWVPRLVAVGTVLGGLVGAMAKTTWTGARTRGPRPDAGFAATALSLFRRKLAPVVGLAVVLLTWYAVIVAVAAYVAAHGGTSAGWWALWGSGAVVFLGVVAGSANRTSLFGFYRSRLSAAYLEVTTPDPASADAIPALGSGPPGDPELVLCGTANVTQPGVLPAGRNGTPFVMGRTVGLTDGRLPGGELMVSAAEYGHEWPHMDVATAVAISGAAVAPVAGRETKVIGAARLLLAVCNVRLGVWLRNPHWLRVQAAAGRTAGTWVDRLNDRFNQLSAFHVVQEATRALRPTLPLLYVTDGGHYDNLGLVDALRRRPAEVIVIDGSGDTEDTFPTMGHAIATARMDLGVEVEFDPAPMTRRPGAGGTWLPPLSGHTTAVARYADGERCLVHYLKCVLPAGLSWDLQSYQLENEGFPAVTTRIEVFDEFDFEAFRALGWALTDAALAVDWAPPGEADAGQQPPVMPAEAPG